MSYQIIPLKLAVFAATCLLTSPFAHAQLERIPADEPALNIISTTKIDSTLVVEGKEHRVSGRISLHLSANEKQLERGVVEVGGFNVAYFGVDQRLIGGGEVRGPQTGVLGFAAKDAGIKQYLTYDAASGHVSGEIFGYVDAEFMARISKSHGDDKEYDHYDTPTQPAYLNVDIFLADTLESTAERSREKRQVEDLHGKYDFQIEVQEDAANGLFANYTLEAVQAEFQLQVTWWLEVAQRLCVQPVRIGRIVPTNPTWPPFGPLFRVEYTGKGLDFGLPGAREQWNKADVVFNVKDWVTVWNSGYFIMSTSGGSTSAEESDLLDEVNDNDCVEVYFVEDFSPESAHGGGATWGSGTSSAKIISSDGNADGGVDFTHLAHELGHALGLLHPNGAPGASTGTLMCPSGWLNDNPDVNSQENKDNVSNPLLTFAFKLGTPGPDCADSGDCGGC